MDENKQFVKEVTEALAGAITSGLRQSVDPVSFAEVRNDLKHAEQALEEVRKTVYDEHHAVVLWTKDFIESYRKVIVTVLASGVIAVAALAIQLYTMIRK